MCMISLATSHPFHPMDKPTGEIGAPGKIQLYVEQHLREVGPRVVIEQLPAGYPKFSILPAEALHLSEALHRLATMATDDSKSVKCDLCEGHPI